MFYVINLKRRIDRKKDFDNKIKNLNIDVNYIEAIDGTQHLPNNNIISYNNDYDSNPRISATILSHYNIWKLIAQGNDDYGIILEDDIYFNHEFNKYWIKIKNKIKYFNNDEVIIYMGMGDFLPIHTKPPSLTLLRAQEKSHIVKNTIRYEYFGEPNIESSYIFNWYGAFSYILNKKSAQKLCILAEQGINKGVDVWLKETSLDKLVTIPLLTYHGAFDCNIYDSDTWGITMPTDDFELKRTDYRTRFLIPVFERSDVVPHFKNTIDTILEYAHYPDQVEFSILYSFNNNDIREYIKHIRDTKNINIYSIQTNNIDYTNIHEYYNDLNRGNKDTTFTAIWEDNKIISEDWDINLFKHYELYESPKLACFQINSNIERNSDKLNNRESTSEIWNFRNPILTTKLLNRLDHVSRSSHVFEYLRYVTYLSKINIFVRDIRNIQLDNNYYNDHMDIIIDNFYNQHIIKTYIDKDIINIQKDVDYRSCGIWIPKPLLWDKTTTIRESRIKFNNRIF